MLPDFLRIIKFAAVGGAFAGLYLILSFLGLYLAALPTWLISLTAYLVCIPAAYLCHKKLVFHSKRAHVATFPAYLAVQLAGIAFSAAIPLFFAFMGWDARLSFPAVVAFVASTSYLVQSRLIFNK